MSQWEGSLRWVAVAAVLFLLMLAAGYRYALPAMASAVAGRLPEPAIDVIFSQVMTALDESVFEPSAVPDDRQRRLASRFGRLALPGVEPGAYQVLFRKSDDLGPNALAIPSGELVVTDALVALAQADEEIVAVLAHEAGHVAGRHGLRQLFQSSAVALAVTWFLGDVSLLATAAPTALLQAKYSRDFEREADRYAVEALEANDVPIEHFVRALERLEKAAAARGTAGPLAYLSSHPVTAERIDSVRRSQE